MDGMMVGTGSIITCGKRTPFGADEIAASVPVAYILADNRGARLGAVLA